MLLQACCRSDGVVYTAHEPRGQVWGEDFLLPYTSLAEAMLAGRTCTAAFSYIEVLSLTRTKRERWRVELRRS